jgi:hypothetical protein
VDVRGLGRLRLVRLSPHSYLDVVRAVSRDLLEAQPLVQGVCAVVDDQYVENHELVAARGFVEELLNEVTADAPPLVVRVDFDAPQLDLGWPVVDGERAGVPVVDGDDLRVGGIETVLVKAALGGFVPAQDRVNIGPQRGAVQPVAEFDVGRRCWSQPDVVHAAAPLRCRSTMATTVSTGRTFTADPQVSSIPPARTP